MKAPELIRAEALFQAARRNTHRRTARVAESATATLRVRPVEGEVARSIEEIPAQEILAATRHAGSSCCPIQIARIFGCKRLTTLGKDRIERAIQVADDLCFGN